MLLTHQKKIQDGDSPEYVSSSIPKWFPALAGEKMEVMRAHHIGPECSTSGPHTLICKILQYTDHNRIMKAARGFRAEVNSRKIRFAAD